MLFPLLVLIATSGCEKTNDVPRLRDEALATAKDYQERFDELAHRAEAIGKRGNTLPHDAPNSADAQRTYGQAQSAIEESRRSLAQVPTMVEAGVKSGNSEDLEKLIASLKERFENGLLQATSELTSVESWIGMVEQRHSAAAAPPPPPSTEDPAPVAPGSDPPVR